MKLLNIQLTGIFFGVMLAAPCAQAQAQEPVDGTWPDPPVGAGIRGANRRVITNRTGYYAVRGRFNVPLMRVPADAVANTTNPKPGFYLGVSQGSDIIEDENGEFISPDPIEVDAGIIFEVRAVNTGRVDSLGRPITVPIGYTPFVRTTSNYTDRKGTFVSTGNQWRSGFGTKNPNVTHFDLAWTIYENATFGIRLNTKGGLLYVNAIGAVNQPTDKVTGEENYIYARDDTGGTHICDSTVTMAAKRVVAINQGGEGLTVGGRSYDSYLEFPLPTGGIYQEDGSFMRNSTFSGMQVVGGPIKAGGEIAKGRVPVDGQAKYFATRPYGNTDNTSLWVPFGSANLSDIDLQANLSSTGWFPGGLDQTNRLPAGIVHPATARPIIEFPDMNREDYIVPTPERYNSEKVSINLRAGVRTAGKRYIVGHSFDTLE